MKTINKIIAVVALMAIPMVSNAQEQKTIQKDNNLETVKFAASITCDNCVNTIMSSLPKEKGIKDVKTDLTAKTVTVTYQKDKNNTEQIKRNLEKLGFTAKVVIDEQVKK